MTKTLSKATVSGFEPLIPQHDPQRRRLWRLPARQIANMLEYLPDSVISLEAFELALQSDNFYLRSTAAKRLIKRTDRPARLLIERVLTDGDSPARANMARHLYGLSWFSAQPRLQQALADGDYQVREGAVYALCRIGTLDAYQFLIAHLEHETDDMVLSAPAMEWGLYGKQDPLGVRVLHLAAKTQNPELRARVMEALGTTATASALPILYDTIRADPDSLVVYHAAMSAVEIGGLAGVADYAAFVKTLEDPARLTACLRGFFQAMNYRHVEVTDSPAQVDWLEALIKAMRHPAPMVRIQATWPLAWMKTPQAQVQVLTCFLEETDVNVKAHLLMVATAFALPQRNQFLTLALQSEDDTLRAKAQILLTNGVGQSPDVDGV
jgi:HEAT repeat protein